MKKIVFDVKNPGSNITVRQVDGDAVLKDLLSRDSEKQLNARALVVNNISTALQAIQHTRELTIRGAADALDEVICEVPDDEAAEIMAQNITPGRLAEALAGRSDLPSNAILVANADMVFEAMMHDLDTLKTETPDFILLLKGWISKIKEHEYFDELLEREIGDHTLFEHLLYIIWIEAGKPGFSEVGVGLLENDDFDEEDVPDSIDDISADKFEAVGLDKNEHIEALKVFIQKDEMPRFDELEIAEAKARILDRRKAIEDSPRTIDEKSKIAAKNAANDEDLEI